MRAVISFAPAPAPASSVSGAAGGCVGLGYGIALAVGVLVLVSTVALASYLCVLTKAGTAHAVMLRTSDGAPTAPAVTVARMGLDGAAIDALYPKYPHVSSGRPGEDDGPCAICLGEFAAGDALRRGHRFHACCAERWLQLSATCPVCRDSPAPSPVATPLADTATLDAHAR